MKPKKRADGTWQINYRDGGKIRSRYFPAGMAGKRQAVEFATEIAHLKAKKEPLPRAPREGVYLDTLTQMWLDEKTVQGRAERWLTEWSRAFNKNFLEPLCAKPAEKITQADVMAVIAAHYSDCKQATRNRYIGYLKATFAHGVKHSLLGKNPLAEWKHGKEPRRKSNLTLQHLRKLVAKAAEDKRLAHIPWVIEVAWHIPARPGKDLFSLRFSDVDFDRGGVQVHHSKVGKDAFVNCDEAFMRELYARKKEHASGFLIEWRRPGEDENGNPHKAGPVKRVEGALQTAARRAELGYQPCMYDIRHLWITTMLDKGIEPSVIAYLAGTSVEMILENYYEPHATERNRAAQLLPAISEPPAEDSRKVVGIAEARRSKKP